MASRIAIRCPGKPACVTVPVCSRCVRRIFELRLVRLLACAFAVALCSRRFTEQPSYYRSSVMMGKFLRSG